MSGPLGFIRSLTIGLYHRWEPERVFVILTAYLDESGTHEGAPVMIMAGYLGHAGAWSRFEQKWSRRLAKERLTHFHCKDFRSRQGEFSGWDDRRYSAFLQNTNRLCETHTLLGFIARLTDEDYQRDYVGPERPKGVQLDSKYGVCFRLCLTVLANMVPKIVEPSKAKVHIVMEAGHRNAGDAERLYSQFKKQAPELAQVFGPITFAEKKECLPVQAADYLAYAAYRYEQRDDIPVMPYSYENDTWDKAKSQVQKTKRPLFRINIDKDVLGELRGNLLAEKEAKKQFGTRRPTSASSE